ncbi:bifunctional adenosylcobinamide kinase/adenosylcobinamide-phosphate guanylyltransferase [Deferribacterales bacterium RsTz2092]
MAEQILITGGHGAGKTAMALKLASGYSRKTYIATSEPIDDEMRLKIERHRAERDETCKTIEEPLELVRALDGVSDTDVVVVDCLTVWLNNLFHYGKDVLKYVQQLYGAIERATVNVIFITNESSLTLVPADRLSREYMRLLAGLNKGVAERVGEVCMMVSGVPMWIKK